MGGGFNNDNIFVYLIIMWYSILENNYNIIWELLLCFLIIAEGVQHQLFQ